MKRTESSREQGRSIATGEEKKNYIHIKIKALIKFVDTKWNGRRMAHGMPASEWERERETETPVECNWYDTVFLGLKLRSGALTCTQFQPLCNHMSNMNNDSCFDSTDRRPNRIAARLFCANSCWHFECRLHGDEDIAERLTPCALCKQCNRIT